MVQKAFGLFLNFHFHFLMLPIQKKAQGGTKKCKFKKLIMDTWLNFSPKCTPWKNPAKIRFSLQRTKPDPKLLKSVLKLNFCQLLPSWKNSKPFFWRRVKLLIGKNHWKNYMFWKFLMDDVFDAIKHHENFGKTCFKKEKEKYAPRTFQKKFCGDKFWKFGGETLVDALFGLLGQSDFPC